MEAAPACTPPPPGLQCVLSSSRADPVHTPPHDGSVAAERETHLSFTVHCVSLQSELTPLLILQSFRILHNVLGHTSTLRSYHRNVFIYKQPQRLFLKTIAHSELLCCSFAFASGERGWLIQSPRRWRERRDGVTPWRKVKLLCHRSLSIMYGCRIIKFCV